jgi:hypothetical protein
MKSGLSTEQRQLLSKFVGTHYEGPKPEDQLLRELVFAAKPSDVATWAELEQLGLVEPATSDNYRGLTARGKVSVLLIRKASAYYLIAAINTALSALSVAFRVEAENQPEADDEAAPT